MATYTLNSKTVPVMVTAINRLLHSPLFIPARNIQGILVPPPSGNIPETPIEWKKPYVRRIYDPETTGDCQPFLTLDMKKSPILVEKSKEIQTADDLVKRLFTFEFLGRKYAIARAKEEMIESVRNHEYDDSSIEVRVVRRTISIRNLLEHRTYSGRDQPAKHILNTLVGKRKKLLRLLRKGDYKRFEWLLEKLDLYYQPEPEHRLFRTRQKSIRQMTYDYCDDLKARRLSEYRQKLENEKESFLREKVKTLKWMRKEEIECGVTPTITEEQIDAAQKKLDDHLKLLSEKVVVVNVSRNIMDSISDQ